MFWTYRQPSLLQLAAVGVATLFTISASSTRADDFSWELDPVSVDWNDPGNWAGPLGGVPDSADDTALVSVIPITGFDPTLTSNRTIGALRILNNGDVLTGDGAGNNYQLIVQQGVHAGTILIEDPGSSLTIYPGDAVSDVRAEAMTINAGGEVLLRGALSRMEVKALDINSGGEISGAGTIWINSVNSIVNDGTIRAEPHGGFSQLFILSTTAGPHFDMDGAGGNGSMEATAGTTLHVQTQIDDPFDGTVTIGPNAEFYMDEAWTLSAGANGTINFNGDTGTATLSGNNLTSDSIINVNSGTAVFDARLFANADSTLNIAAHTTVEFSVQANLRNPDNIHNGNASTWIINGDVTVGEGNGDFDWDGETSASSTTIVNPDSRLNIDVERVDKGFLEAYQGTIEMNSGRIDVQNSDGQWEMAGALNMHRVAGEPIAVLSGVELLISGDVRVSGTGESRITAATIFDTTSSVDVGSAAELGLGDTAPIAFIGGEWTGSGTVRLNADWNVIYGPTTVNMPDGVFDLDGHEVNRLTISAPLTLNVRAVDDFDNEIRDDIEIKSDAQLNVEFTNPADTYRIITSLDLEALGGTESTVHLAGAAVELAGATNVTGNSISDAPVTIAGPMQIASGGSLRLRGGTAATPDWILSGATFTGSGSLINSGGSAMALEHTAAVGVELINQGRLEIGSSTGTAHVDSYIQEASGQYAAEIDGLNAVFQYDQLTVENDVHLEGTLEILVNENGGDYADPSVPGTLDEFLLIVSGDAVAGQFSDFIYDGDPLTLTFSGGGMHRFHIGEGLFRILAYGESDVGLLNYQALPGDANGDGNVDGLDFIIWNSHKFTSGNKWISGDFTGDGHTDGLDFIVWNAHKFTSVSGFPTLVPEPTAATLLWMALLLLRRQAGGLCLARGYSNLTPASFLHHGGTDDTERHSSD